MNKLIYDAPLLHEAIAMPAIAKELLTELRNCGIENISKILISNVTDYELSNAAMGRYYYHENLSTMRHPRIFGLEAEVVNQERPFVLMLQ